jgi:hypothetical protein
MSGARRTVMFVVPAAVLAAVAVGASLQVFRSQPKPLPRTHPIRVTMAEGCPSRIAGSDGVRNPEPGGLDLLVVPANPTRVLVCRFASILPTGEGGEVSRSIVLAREESRLLAHDLDEISSTGVGAYSCPGSAEKDVDVIVFAYKGRADVDVWSLRNGCVALDNGYLLRTRITPRVRAEFDKFTQDLERLILSG